MQFPPSAKMGANFLSIIDIEKFTINTQLNSMAFFTMRFTISNKLRKNNSPSLKFPYLFKLQINLPLA